MTIRTKITACIAALAALVLVLAAGLLLSLERSHYDMQRSSLAYEELTGYLELGNEVLRAAKLVRRDLGTTDLLRLPDLAATRARLRATQARIVDVVEAEVATGLRDGEEFEETARLEELARALDSLLEGLSTVQSLHTSGQREEAIDLLDQMVETEINSRLEPLIEAASADEREELVEAQEHHDALHRLALVVGLIVGGLAIILAVGSVVFLVRQVRRPLGNLAGWADRVASGDLDARVNSSGVWEFDRLGHQFNRMADEISRSRRQLEQARDSLEDEVAARTEELRGANAELQRRDALRQRFFADVGHELRTPITAVRGEAEIALRSRTDHKQRYREALELIVTFSGQLTRFVDDIFLIARAESGLTDMRRSTVELDRAVHEAIDQLRSTASSRNALITNALPDTPVCVEGDADRLRQLVAILVKNAIEHGPPGVNIEVAVAAADNMVTLAVSDDGPGVSREQAANIFDRFHRDNHGATEGSGLGLPIARSIVIAHRGRITFDSAVGRGSRVIARFRRAEPEAASSGERASAESVA